MKNILKKLKSRTRAGYWMALIYAIIQMITWIIVISSGESIPPLFVQALAQVGVLVPWGIMADNNELFGKIIDAISFHNIDVSLFYFIVLSTITLYLIGWFFGWLFSSIYNKIKGIKNKK